MANMDYGRAIAMAEMERRRREGKSYLTRHVMNDMTDHEIVTCRVSGTEGSVWPSAGVLMSPRNKETTNHFTTTHILVRHPCTTNKRIAGSNDNHEAPRSQQHPTAVTLTVAPAGQSWSRLPTRTEALRPRPINNHLLALPALLYGPQRQDPRNLPHSALVLSRPETHHRFASRPPVRNVSRHQTLLPPSYHVPFQPQTSHNCYPQAPATRDQNSREHPGRLLSPNHINKVAA